MKKLLIIFSATCLAVSCGSDEAAEGLALTTKSDCHTCHKVTEASTGPSFESIAERYGKTPQVIDTLSEKIIQGGSGTWGMVPMTPHPAISKEDAKTMVKYILSLKK